MQLYINSVATWTTRTCHTAPQQRQQRRLSCGQSWLETATNANWQANFAAQTSVDPFQLAKRRNGQFCCQLTVSASAAASASVSAWALAAATTATDTRRRHYAKPAKRQIKNANAVSHRGCTAGGGGLLARSEGPKGFVIYPAEQPAPNN